MDVPIENDTAHSGLMRIFSPVRFAQQRKVFTSSYSCLCEIVRTWIITHTGRKYTLRLRIHLFTIRVSTRFVRLHTVLHSPALHNSNPAQSSTFSFKVRQKKCIKTCGFDDRNGLFPQSVTTYHLRAINIYVRRLHYNGCQKKTSSSRMCDGTAPRANPLTDKERDAL